MSTAIIKGYAILPLSRNYQWFATYSYSSDLWQKAQRPGPVLELGKPDAIPMFWYSTLEQIFLECTGITWTIVLG